MEWVETTGRTVADALDAALDQLGVNEDDVEFEVIQEPKSGLLGRREARIRARVKPISREKPGGDRRRRKGREGSGGGGSRNRSGRGAGRSGSKRPEGGGGSPKQPATGERRRGVTRPPVLRAPPGRSGDGEVAEAAAGAGIDPRRGRPAQQRHRRTG